jgi:Ca2+:H+ antiporter
LLTFGAVGRALVGWIAVGGLALLSPPHTSPLLGATLAGTVAVIAVCAFGVVRQAELIAARLGDPLGTPCRSAVKPRGCR